MKMMRSLLWGVVTGILLLASMVSAAPAPRSFGSEVQFLKKHVHVVVLSDPASGARVAVVPAYQGRIMTSAAAGDRGASFGWINHSLIASGHLVQHMNAFGGEDRFWLGPEGGQFGLFFKSGAPFNLAHWFTPAAVDTEPFALVGQTGDTARFRRTISLSNASGSRFRVGVSRTIHLIRPGEVWRSLKMPAQLGVRMVAVESQNRITNLGKQPWRKETGELSIWILGMYNPGPRATIVIPFKPNVEPGPVVNDAYFGKVPPSRLVVKGNVLFFRGDGKYRSKIGIAPRRALTVLGSYDPDAHVLTLIQYTGLRPNDGYVNSMWEMQQNPYGGDVVNSYNDGPPAPGARPLGPFFELETSSPAAGLTPGASIDHTHRTIHLQGTEAALDPIARKMLGVSLEEIETAFPG